MVEKVLWIQIILFHGEYIYFLSSFNHSTVLKACCSYANDF